jgi:3-methyladenine DNA glycosylase AlkD
MYSQIISELGDLRSPTKATQLSRFFKTGVGQYGEGDVFWGITVPQIRIIVSKYYKTITLSDINKLLINEVHEIRLCGALLLVAQYQKSKDKNGKTILYNFYLDNLKSINNWDLVDLTCHKIIGDYLLKYNNSDISILRDLSLSNDLWERRISVISTFVFIRNQRLDLAMEICERLLFDKHDIIHKAVGWMLREIGKRDYQYELSFVKKHKYQMPRTMLRYAIEKFPENIRQELLLKI